MSIHNIDVSCLGLNGEKQIKAIQNQGPVETIKKYTDDDKDSPLISKEKEIFQKLTDERLDEITKLTKKLTLIIWYINTKVNCWCRFWSIWHCF